MWFFPRQLAVGVVKCKCNFSFNPGQKTYRAYLFRKIVRKFVKALIYQWIIKRNILDVHCFILKEGKNARLAREEICDVWRWRYFIVRAKGDFDIFQHIYQERSGKKLFWIRNSERQLQNDNGSKWSIRCRIKLLFNIKQFRTIGQ